MGTINLKEARKRLGDLVNAAERGESTVITRRGRKVARIVPLGRKPRRGLPDLTEFRASHKWRWKQLSRVVIDSRKKARY